jgi:two-component system cell cycle response regulator DivK
VGNELILVVEDNDMSRKLVRDVLTVKGYEIVEAETGEEGVGLAQERRPSLILMDIRLPGIDGIQALGRLRAEVATRGIPVMAMTASVMTNDRQKVLDAGFDSFQSKPIKIKDFVAAVEQLLERHRK